METSTLEEAIAALLNDWERKPGLDTNEQLGREVTELIKELVRLQRGVTSEGADRDAVDAETLAKLKDPNTLGPEHSIAEAVFRRLVNDPALAVDYLEQSIKDRSEAQSKRARNPRRREKITLVIEEILEDQTSLSAKAVGKMLTKHEDIIWNGEEYRHIDDASTLTEVRLSSRVSDAKKRLKNNSA